MAGFSLQVDGMDEVLQALENLRAGASEIGLKHDSLSSPLEYAFGQNYGEYRNGQLARRAGPTYFFESGIKAIEDSAYDQLAPAIVQGSTQARQAWAVLMRRGVVAAQNAAPVKTGRLRRSIHSADAP
jgi:hypothetical protein